MADENAIDEICPQNPPAVSRPVAGRTPAPEPKPPPTEHSEGPCTPRQYPGTRYFVAIVVSLKIYNLDNSEAVECDDWESIELGVCTIDSIDLTRRPEVVEVEMAEEDAFLWGGGHNGEALLDRILGWCTRDGKSGGRRTGNSDAETCVDRTVERDVASVEQPGAREDHAAAEADRVGVDDAGDGGIDKGERLSSGRDRCSNEYQATEQNHKRAPRPR